MVKKIADMGFKICASEGTSKVLRSNGVNAKTIPKIGEGKPDIIDLIKAGEIDLIINVPAGKKSLIDSKPIRSAAVVQGVTYITTLEGAQAAISGMDSLEETGFSVKTIQEYAGCLTGGADKKNTVDVRKTLWS
jgi:carbamoyl-phosphate synthase large subunit